jgi:hypothetical protein
LTEEKKNPNEADKKHARWIVSDRVGMNKLNENMKLGGKKMNE